MPQLVNSDLISFYKPLTLAVSLSVAAVLSACSGGSGGSNSSKDTIPPTLSLVGDSQVTLLLDQPFQDAGVSASDNIDGDISSKVQSSSLVDTSKVGNYEVTYNVSDSAGNAAVSISRSVNVIQTGKAQLGPLVGATADIYLINDDGSLSLLFTETTTDGDINSAGQFDFHYSELEEDKWYLVKVTGGEDIDANDDGVIDATPTQNLGSIHLVFQKKLG